MRYWPLFLALSGIGCANPAHIARDFDPVAMVHCFRSQALALDDRISNARSVGLSVARACANEINESIETATEGSTGDYRRGFAESFWSRATEEATQFVLRQRARR